MVHTFRRQCVFDPQLGCVWMGASVKDRSCANLKGGSVFGYDQLDIVISLKDLINTVMEETDTDDTLTWAYHLGWAGAGLDVYKRQILRSRSMTNRSPFTSRLLVIP